MLARGLIGGIVFSLACGSALAQQATIADTLVVTTTRSQSQWLRNPSNITSLTPDMRFETPAQLLNRASNVAISQNNGQEHLTAIRSPTLTGGAGAGSFLFMEDGVPMRAAAFANVNALLDALPQQSERAELVRGPASALYGGNAVHGSVNFISRTPYANELFADYNAGSFGRQQFHISAANTIREKNVLWGGRNSVSLAYDGGYRDNSNGKQTKLRMQAGRRDAKNDLQLTFTGVQFQQNTAGYVRGHKAYKNKELARSNPQVASGLRPYRNANALRGMLRWEHKFSDTNTLRITPYWRSNDMEFLMHFLPGTPTEQNEHWSVGAQSAWQNDFDSLTIIAGLDWEFSKGTLREVQTADDTGFGTPYKKGVHYDYAVQASLAAPFVHSVIALGNRAQAIVGVRLEWAQHDYDNRLAGEQDFGRNRRPADRTDDYLTFAPKVGLNYQFHKHWLGFINYARAAHAPQTTDAYRLRITQSVGDIKAETLDSIEAGIRHQQKGLRGSLTGFYMQKRNFYFRDADDNNVPNGRTSHYGIEAEGEWDIAPSLTLAGAASYARHQYDFNRPVRRNITEAITKGDDVDGAPRTLANVRVVWRPLAKLSSEWEWVHIGRYYMDASNQHRYGGHNLVHWNINYALTQNIALYLNIQNLFNAKYATRADYWFGRERYFAGEPINAYGGIKLTF